MRKIITGTIVAIAAVAAFNVNMNTQNENLSDLSLANVEALAQSESLPYPVYIVTAYSPFLWKCAGGGSMYCP
jgi:hypothetical protein